MKGLRIELVLVCCFAASSAANLALIIRQYHGQKHTGPVTLALIATPRSFWFVRPNQEFFEMFFDNPPQIRNGAILEDLVYTDDNGWERHFVSARIAQPPASGKPAPR
jgi:hypothetical protein